MIKKITVTTVIEHPNNGGYILQRWNINVMTKILVAEKNTL